MTVEYNSEIEEQILSHLDGWEIIAEPVTDDESNTEQVNSNTNSTGSTNNGEVQPFIDDIIEYKDNPNKRVKEEEVQSFYEEALSKSYLHCNRFNIDDLTAAEEQMFLDGVCLLAASDLWNKYNVRVNSEDLEDVYVQSYGGLLYQQSMKILQSFINQRVISLTNLKNKKEQNLNIWQM